MLIDKPAIKARVAHLSLQPHLIGFVERGRHQDVGAHLELPFAIPVVHVALECAGGAQVAFSSGRAIARAEPASGSHPTFVVAIGFSGAATLLRPWMAEGFGRFVELEDAFWNGLAARLSAAGSFAARAALAEAVLAERLASSETMIPHALRAADAIVSDRWRGPVTALATAFGIEERTLRNRFRGKIGWTPKKLLRVARFNRALRTLHPQSWAGAPGDDVRLEFADEAHFHHEFVAHAGITPRAFVMAKRSSGDAMLHNLRL